MLDSAQRTKKEAATCRNKNQSELSNQRAKARGELQKPPARSRWRFLNWMIAPPFLIDQKFRRKLAHPHQQNTTFVRRTDPRVHGVMSNNNRRACICV